jgi:hypothetical protein
MQSCPKILFIFGEGGGRGEATYLWVTILGGSRACSPGGNHFGSLNQINIVKYTAISIKVVHEQSGKVEYERERLLGIPKKLMNFHSDSQQPFALVFDFSALLGDNH